MNAISLQARDTASWGAGLLRVALGVMYLTHSLLLKVYTYGMDGTAKFFESIGLPGPLAYVVVVMEVVGGALLVANVKARWVAAALIPILLGATWTHAGNGWVFSNPNGGWEYPVFLVVASLVVMLTDEKR
jgi:putative oxidoreductase